MANISQNVNIEMLEKLPDGTYKRKYPKTRADDGTTFDEHLAEKASQNKLGHVKVDGITIFINEEGEISVRNPLLDDNSGSPGPKILISGTMEEGFFGEVPASELITGNALASQVGISQGTSQHSTAGWLKFAYKGEILFVAKKPIRHSISWDAINTANCVYGDRVVMIGGKPYIVRLMKSALTDPSLYDTSDRGAKGSEWNRLMLPIHEQSIDKSWTYSAYVEDDIPIWNHNLGTGANGMYTDADLMTHNSHGNGSYHWGQETRNTSATRRVLRGGLGVSYSDTATATSTIFDYGWSPVLELVEED